jgi:chemotaxis protein MotA
MEISTIIGIVMSFGGVLAGYMMEEGTINSLIKLPAFLIVIVGTFGAAVTSMPLIDTISLPKVLRNTLFRNVRNPHEIIAMFVEFAEKVRREGLLVLEEDVSNLKDDFLRSGLQLVIDGNDTDLVRDILNTEVSYLEGRHERGAKYFKNLGGFAPTFGIIGTVMSLVTVLAGLGASIDPASLGEGISSAFIATLYGVVSANALFLPMANKLELLSSEEALVREIMIEGILSIQAGDNPRIVKEKLNAFLPPQLRMKEE